MTTFKAKQKKHGPTSNKETLHAKHLDMVKVFKSSNKTLSAKQRTLTELNQQLAKTNGLEKSPESVAKAIELEEEIRQVNADIHLIESNAEEDAYYEKNADLIYAYFQNIDEIAAQVDPVEVPEPEESAPAPVRAKKPPKVPKGAAADQGKPKIMDFFNKGSAATPETDVPVEELAVVPEKQVVKHGLNNFVHRKENFKRAKMLDVYMSNIDPTHVISLEHVKEEPCPECMSEMFLNQNDGVNECLKCGWSELVRVDSDKRSYKESTEQILSYCVYKRMNHFREWLNMTEPNNKSCTAQGCSLLVAVAA